MRISPTDSFGSLTALELILSRVKSPFPALLLYKDILDPPDMEM